MDEFISTLPAEADDDLMVTPGMAYQRDMTCGRVFYGAAYMAKVMAYEGSDIAKAVNRGRCALLARHLEPLGTVLDIGAGSGAFVREARSWGFAAHGYDVMPEAMRALRADGLYDEDPALFDAVTLWDVVEHLEDPGLMLRRINKGALLCLSLPIFADLRRVRESRHYRPGEHLTYWTAQGLIDWIALYGFRLLEQSDHETAAGRESIGAFAFRRDLK